MARAPAEPGKRVFEAGDELENRFGQSTVDYGFEKIRAKTYHQIRRVNRQREADIHYDENSLVEYHMSDTALIGTMEQHLEREKTADETAQMSYNSNDIQITPKFVYKGDNPSSWYDLGESTGPINLGWNIGKSASGVASEHNTSGSYATLFAGTRYIINAYGITSQNKDIGEDVCYTLYCTSPEQYHARLYDNDFNDDDASVIGQAHHDPVDHGAITNPDWDFSESRKELSEHWSDTTTMDINNGTFSSSNGKLDYITGSSGNDNDGLDIPFIII